MIRKRIEKRAVVALLLGGVYACTGEIFRVTSTQTVLAEAMSPDGDWKAVEYEDLYEGPFLTYSGAGVRLVSMRDPARSADILGVPANIQDERPTIAWIAPRTLGVDVPSSVDLKMLTCDFDGVRIDIRLPPEDAANRAAYFGQTGEPDPDPGGVLARKCP
jgi:hypothetical protein